ncbi:MAG: right-handed parallel beta-helix repeat-containing protein, partial [Planctomycetota bacterium]
MSGKIAGFILSCVLTLLGTVHGATIYVPDDYSKIQAAIDAAADGDTLIVRPGTYVENIDFKGKAITLQSEQGADVTVIDGNQNGSVVTCQSGEGADSVLDGFTITNGGGMCNWESSPTVTHCIFTNNWAGEGGGMFNEDSSPTVTHCTFTENYACRGGGVYNLNSSPTLTQCTFFKNFASGGPGGDPYGGGMFDEQSNTSVVNCTFIENYSMYITFGSFPTVINTILWNNWGWGGLVCIQYSSTLTISYSDVSGGKTSCHVEPGCTLYWGDGMIDADPRLVDPVNGDLHLTWLSPCINRGTNDGAPLEDIDGDPIPYMGTVDMGADEFIGVHP